jgi:hypothetical protein
MRNVVMTVLRKVRALPAVALGGLILGTQSAHAQLDTTAITGAFTEAETGVGAIAAVMLGVVAAGIAVKWVLGFIIS